MFLERNSLKKFIETFENNIMNNSFFKKRCIISPINNYVEGINNTIYNMIEGRESIYALNSLDRYSVVQSYFIVVNSFPVLSQLNRLPKFYAVTSESPNYILEDKTGS